MRLRLSSSRQPYRRGGWKIGPKNAPTLVEPGDVRPGSLLAVLRDPVVTFAREVGEDVWETPSAAERAEAAGQIEAAIAAQELADKDGLARLVDELLGTKEFEDPAGWGGEASGAAASGVEPEPQASDALNTNLGGVDAVDQGGAPGASAATGDEAREPAGEAAADRNGASNAEQKPGETGPPPVAAQTNPARKAARPRLRVASLARRKPHEADAPGGG